MLADSNSLDLVLVALETELLSEAMLKLHAFAQANGRLDLSEWAIAELHGYPDDALYPSYRNISLQYFDKSGQAIPSLSEQYGTWPLLNGIEQLESQVKYGLTLKLPPEILDFLSQACDRTVFGGHVNPSQIAELLTHVRAEAISRLKNV
jgi:hypothetical protein